MSLADPHGRDRPMEYSHLVFLVEFSATRDLRPDLFHFLSNAIQSLLSKRSERLFGNDEWSQTKIQNHRSAFVHPHHAPHPSRFLQISLYCHKADYSEFLPVASDNIHYRLFESQYDRVDCEHPKETSKGPDPYHTY